MRKFIASVLIILSTTSTTMASEQYKVCCDHSGSCTVVQKWNICPSGTYPQR